MTKTRVAEFWAAYKQHNRDVEETIERRVLEKLSLLMDHYGIADRSNWETLARTLASEHVRGLRIISDTGTKRGRKKEWDGPKLLALLETVETVKQRHGFTDRQGLAFIVNNAEHAPTWGQPQNHRGTNRQWIETLESRLYDAKRYAGFLQSTFDSLLIRKAKGAGQRPRIRQKFRKR